MALYNHLFARRHGGKWILRIEDTDMSRHVPGSVEGIRKALDWAGLNYDYGPGREGPHAPYFQSERLDLYNTYAGKLIESGHAYRCFCTPDDLAEIKGKLARAGSSSSYDRRCLHLTEEEVARRLRAGEKHTIRFNTSVVPDRPSATDLIFGRPKDAHASLATDPILLKSDQFPTYHLASVVDDHEMGITHVLRGEEWLPSLPLHLDIYASLNLPTPLFGHLPILLNPDGSKMSKRHGDVRVEDFIKRGWEPEAVLNWAVLSGWGVSHAQNQAQGQNQDQTQHAAVVEENGQSTPAHAKGSNFVPDSTQIMTLDEMIEQFDISALTHRNTILEASKLEYINKRHLMRRASTREGLKVLAGKRSDRYSISHYSKYTTIDMIKKAIMLLEGRLFNIYDIPLHAPYLFVEPDLSSTEARSMRSGIPPDDCGTLHSSPLSPSLPPSDADSLSYLARILQHVKTTLESSTVPWDDLDILDVLHKERERLGVKVGVFMRTLRWGVTGMKDGPAIADVMDVIGRERTLARLSHALTV
ncbi:hypothetical protein CVT26_011029 [Gymnopilus dilepis]|uniref:Uncharacterized protein n=1 Tax=Gymnopilus dilepis TaxID=231916 RepID=A0A409VY31_9AGAR|nr:hypothetical protein CVT26_011029 [Gymnopilus dilepis]